MPHRARYAVYYMPEDGSVLADLGARWLGLAAPAPALPEGMTRDRWQAITADARHYGFHATLRAPFRLDTDISEADLLSSFHAFAADTAPAHLPGFEVADLHGFIALRPAGAAPELDALADACVRFADPLRAPLTEAEIARRRPDMLSERQRALLHRWGYPFVMEEFRFHMTLTARLAELERTACMAHLSEFFAPVTRKPATLTGLALCIQPAPDAPFHVLARAQTGLAETPVERRPAAR